MSVFTKDATQIADALGAFSKSMNITPPEALARTDSAAATGPAPQPAPAAAAAAPMVALPAQWAQALQVLAAAGAGRMGFTAFTGLLSGDAVTATTDMVKDRLLTLDSEGSEVVVRLTEAGREKVS